MSATFPTFSDGKHVYNVERLWQLTRDLPVVTCPRAELDPQLQRATWNDESGQPISPADLLSRPSRSFKHTGLVNVATFDYPLLVYDNKEMTIIDGMHRLALAFKLKHEMVRVRRVSKAILKEARCGRVRGMRSTLL